jgi:hypothetical protein
MLVGALGSGSGWSCTGLAEGDGAEGFRGTDDPDQENFGRHSSSTLKRTDSRGFCHLANLLPVWLPSLQEPEMKSKFLLLAQPISSAAAQSSGSPLPRPA